MEDSLTKLLGASNLLDIKRSFCLFIFNRATYSRIARVIEVISEDKNIDLTVVLSGALLKEEFGSAYTYIETGHKNVSFYKMHLEDCSVNPIKHCLVAAEIARATAGYLKDKSFDAIILVADRFETLPCAMSAAYLNFPIIHIQGGEITGNIDEKVRHSVTKLSDYHFVSTKCAKKYVKRMGEERVYEVGCPSLDLISKWNIQRSARSEKYILCIFHPDTERIELQYEQTRAVLEAAIDFCKKNKYKCYWYWPNPDPGREEIIRLLTEAHEHFKDVLIKAVNEEPFDFLYRLAGARLILGNSSVGLRESSFMGVPSINVGDRQNLRERSFNVMDVPADKKLIFEAMEHQNNVYKYKRSFLYGRGQAAYWIHVYLAKLDFTLKGALKYPLLPEFRDDHLGEKRLHDYDDPRLYGGQKSQAKVQDLSRKRRYLQGKLRKFRQGRTRRIDETPANANTD